MNFALGMKLVRTLIWVAILITIVVVNTAKGKRSDRARNALQMLVLMNVSLWIFT